VTPFENEFLRKLLKERSGLVLAADKQYLIESRLMPVARRAGYSSISELVQKLQSSNAENLRMQVTEAMTINESLFFRDMVPFDRFRDMVLPSMLETRTKTRRLRIWCTAASTGQEPYSLAMIIRSMKEKFFNWTIDIIATDISHEVLEKAKAGVYSQFEVQRGLPIQMLLQHFDRVGEHWRISTEIRKMVQFRHFNLLANFSSLGTFDVVFCRNVLIYFDHSTKIEVLGRIAQSLAPDGFLLMGAVETVVGLTDSLMPLPDKRGLYVRALSGEIKPKLATA